MFLQVSPRPTPSPRLTRALCLQQLVHGAVWPGWDVEAGQGAAPGSNCLPQVLLFQHLMGGTGVHRGVHLAARDVLGDPLWARQAETWL